MGLYVGIVIRSLRRALAIIVKEYKHIWFDPGFLFLTVFSPAVLLTLLSYIFSFDVDNARLAVINQDQSPRSFEYIRTLTADGSLIVVDTAQNTDQIVRLFRENRADAVLTIPPGFERDLEAGKRTPVSLAVDGADPGTAFQVINAVQQRTVTYTNSLSATPRSPFEVRIRVWFNPNLRSQHSMIPGLLALVLILPAMAVALAVTRERDAGTFEMLVTTPIRATEYLLGKLVVYLSMGLIGALLALAVAVFWFKVPFRGSLGLFLLLTADYLFAIMSYALIVARFVPNQRAVTSAVLLSLFIPGFFMTGLMLPVDPSPAAQAMAFSLPVTHYIVIARGVALKGLEMSHLLPEVGTLFGYGVLMSLLSVLLFNKKVRV